MINNDFVTKIQYGLFFLSTKSERGDNASVINTVMQITDTPKRIAVCVNKDSYNCEIIKNTGALNISVLNENVTFDDIKRFGFQSGRDVDKFDGYTSELGRSENGIVYFKSVANTFISATVFNSVDCGTHIMFLCDVVEADVINDVPSITYEYYHKNIKVSAAPKKKGYVCKICGYVYEGDELPEDFICPWCKHGADAFEEK